MVRHQQGQAVLVAGESGAGKTEATKYILHYLSEAAPASSTDGIPVHQQLLQSNPIMEAFGNAKTVRNNNSSRFGKLFSIYFSPPNPSDTKSTARGCRIQTASVTNYLLEKSRVVWQADGERNYHVYYQILAQIRAECGGGGGTPHSSPLSDIVKEGGGDGVGGGLLVDVVKKCIGGAAGGDGSEGSVLSYLSNLQSVGRTAVAKAAPPSAGSKGKGKSKQRVSCLPGKEMLSDAVLPDSESEAVDLQLYKETVEGMESLGIGADERSSVWRVLVAIITLGNASFVPDSENAKEPEAIKPIFSAGSGDVCNWGMGECGALLGVTSEALTRCLCYRQMGGGRGSVIHVPYKTAEAEDARDALCKRLHAHMFDWLIHRINVALGDHGGVADSAGCTIGVLDIFGFEIFEHNSFEQLCINYCNEKLQGFFNEHIFTLEQQEYDRYDR